MAGDASTIPESPIIMIDVGAGTAGTAAASVDCGTAPGDSGAVVVRGRIVVGGAAVVLGALVVGATVVGGTVVVAAAGTGARVAAEAFAFVELEQLVAVRGRTVAAASTHRENRDLISRL